ncbi:hypothetical protein QJS04_geneDACA021548 [Acorus gramineus]|uniref:ENTH domain-containing protein n=1 Tax=Acorus gramineus TaxID=55184 RepID=A0AAV9B5M9_ACOGR|nr:hypothetical protein QJS04_geneDACA021548 [Acorus gramineus]
MSSILRSRDMGAPFLHELKKQASFFLKEKIRTARLALTDVTPAQLLTEEATNGAPCGPETRTMGLIARAAFEIDDYWRIVEILHKRFERFEKKQWRETYKSVILLEHLMMHGPETVFNEFQSDKDAIKDLGSFQYIDEKGFNWGLNARKKSERVLKLLENGELLKEERERTRKIARGIQGFGSFSRLSLEGDERVSPTGLYERSHSQYNDRNVRGDSSYKDAQKENERPVVVDKDQPLSENVVLKNVFNVEEMRGWGESPRESKPLLGSCVKGGKKIEFRSEADRLLDRDLNE